MHILDLLEKMESISAPKPNTALNTS